MSDDLYAGLRAMDAARDKARHEMQPCPECQNKQVELLDAASGWSDWRCRKCKHKWTQ